MDDGPVRSCVACKRKRAQADLLRVAANADGSVVVDDAIRSDGRGAYICPDPSCVGTALAKGRLARALRHQGELPDGLRRGLERSAAARSTRSAVRPEGMDG